jgi:phosphatidylinositol kinase/protein kinase (PI-3  family)
MEVGRHHPQALIYPLTVASQSSNKARKDAALLIMDQLRSHSSAIVEQVRPIFPRNFICDNKYFLGSCC